MVFFFYILSDIKVIEYVIGYPTIRSKCHVDGLGYFSMSEVPNMLLHEIYLDVYNGNCLFRFAIMAGHSVYSLRNIL